MPDAAFDSILKRDGRRVPFDAKKITIAIRKAGEATGEFGETESRRLTHQVLFAAQNVFEGRVPGVEEIQDLVEEALLQSPYKKTAKAFIIYRDQHNRSREIADKAGVDLVDQYLERTDWQVRENSNMSYSLQGLNNHVASEISKVYWSNKIYPAEIRDAHRSADFHLHDLGMLSVYCVGWDLYDLLGSGFTGAPGKVESAPAKHFRTALGQVVNFFYTLQGEAAGAQAFSNFDTLLAPFIRYDRLTYKEVKQALQEFLFNVNVPTRVGFQTPFTNVTLDVDVPSTLADQAVVIGGKLQEEKYGDFQAEMDLFNKAFLEVMCEGDAKGRVFTFPIPTYNIGKDFAWDDPRHEPLWQATAKYGIPYFANFVNSDMNPEDARSMCPLAGTEKVLIRSSRGRDVEYSMIRNIFEGSSQQEQYEVYSDGKFVKGRFARFKNQKMIRVSLDNGHEIEMTHQHLNFVLDGGREKVLQGKELVPGMHLPYSLTPHEGEGGEPELGFFIGAYAGDGSFDRETSVVFSLENTFKKELIGKLASIAARYFGARTTVTPDKKTKLVTLKVHSKAAVGLCKDFVEGKEREKRYAAKLFTMSRAFREQVLAGHYATDGGNRHRIYTSSRKMVETLNLLAATLGTTTSVWTDDRKGRFSEHPNYAVLVYRLNREKYGKTWLKKNGKLWVRIKAVSPIKNSTAYCFEVESGRPMFTVGTTGILTHNCRLRIDNRQIQRRLGGLFGSAPLTGSVGVVTINLPRLGYLAESEADFLKRLGALMDLAKESLEIKRKVLERFTEAGLYPYMKFYLRDIRKRMGCYWANHFSTIGLVGMNEACLNLLGEGIASERGHAFAQEVLRAMRERLGAYAEETGHPYNLEATPAEGTSYRLAKADKARYPDILCANEASLPKGAAPFYTNSSQLPVDHTEDPFEVLEKQDDLQSLYTGGTVQHLFMGERIRDTKALRGFVKTVCGRFHLPYFSITPTFSVCPSCGYQDGEKPSCPTCGSTCEVYSRVVGYIRPVSQWNDGKQAEFEIRKTASV